MHQACVHSAWHDVSSIANLVVHWEQDPGNLESDLQAGANANYSLLWMFMWSTLMVRSPRLSLGFF